MVWCTDSSIEIFEVGREEVVKYCSTVFRRSCHAFLPEKTFAVHGMSRLKKRASACDLISCDATLCVRYAHFRCPNMLSLSLYASRLDPAMRIISLIPRVLDPILKLWDGVAFAHEHHLDIPIATEMIPFSFQLINLGNLLIAQISGFNASALPYEIG